MDIRFASMAAFANETDVQQKKANGGVADFSTIRLSGINDWFRRLEPLTS